MVWNQSKAIITCFACAWTIVFGFCCEFVCVCEYHHKIAWKETNSVDFTRSTIDVRVSSQTIVENIVFFVRTLPINWDVRVRTRRVHISQSRNLIQLFRVSCNRSCIFFPLYQHVHFWLIYKLQCGHYVSELQTIYIQKLCFCLLAFSETIGAQCQVCVNVTAIKSSKYFGCMNWKSKQM